MSLQPLQQLSQTSSVVKVIFTAAALGLIALVGVSTAAAQTGSNTGSGYGGGSISNTGPGSTNVITTTVVNSTTTSNHNSVSVHTSSNQNGSSGNASVSGNTTGGSATSGPVSNTNSSDTTINISNN